MAPTRKEVRWYTLTKPTDLQGIIADEATGATIAVTYDPKHATLLAEAPNLLRALRGCTTEEGSHAIASGDPERLLRRLREVDRIARAAIAEVEEAIGS